MGGAAGHMNHPFDLSWVNSGSDLLDFFDRAKTFVEKKGAAAVKIDGVNVSFKVVDGPGGKEFAVDRGSLKSIDVEGITMGRVDQRFPEGHGMRPAIKTLLAILNKSLPNIEKQLAQLGMLDDPTKFLNTEYVAGTTNVTEYDENFLAIHGLNQFYHKIGKSGAAKGMERPGMERPEGIKAASVEVPYDPAVMEKLVKNLQPVAEEYGFKVYSSVPTEKMADIDYSTVLSEPFTVRVSDDREITKSLEEWLSEATNPRYKAIKLKDGSRTHPLHKQLYLNILNGVTPIVDLIEDNDAEAAIYGAVLMHATRMLGNQVLRGLTSPMGDVMGHEGIVMRDDKLFGPSPVKITGEFIVGNIGGGFGQVNEEEEEFEIVDQDESNPAPTELGARIVALVPGAFKPPHRGHVEMVEKYAFDANEVVVLISSPLKQQRTFGDGSVINAEHSKQIWERLTSHLPNVDVQISNRASPIQATYEYIDENGPLEPGTEVILGVCTKGGDVERFRMAEKYLKKGVTLRPLEACAVAPGKHSPEYMEILNMSPLRQEMPSVVDNKDPSSFHASDMRYLLGKASEDEEAVELLEDFVGSDNIFDVLSILGINTGANEPLEEISVMGGAGGGGDVEGYSVPLGSTLVKRAPAKKKRKKKKNENIDMSLVNEVFELLIERGNIL